VSVSEQKHVASTRDNTVYYCLSPGCNLLDAFSARNSILPERPIRSYVSDVISCASLVFAVIPFLEIRILLRDLAKAGETTGFTCSDQWTCQHDVEAVVFQEPAYLARILLSFVRQWNIRSSRMLPGDAPLGFPVTHKPQLQRLHLSHWRVLASCSASSC